ncbi:MAG: hypothetical protein ACM3KR_04795 [Deltaproteobacteria bacterium]
MSTTNEIKEMKGIENKLDLLAEHIYQLENQLIQLSVKEEKPSPVTSENDIKKYTKAAKIAARVIEVIADGVAVVFDSINEPPASSTSSASKITSSMGNLEASTLLNATEKFIHGLSTSLQTNTPNQ